MGRRGALRRVRRRGPRPDPVSDAARAPHPTPPPPPPSPRPRHRRDVGGARAQVPPPRPRRLLGAVVRAVPHDRAAHRRAGGRVRRPRQSVQAQHGTRRGESRDGGRGGMEGEGRVGGSEKTHTKNSRAPAPAHSPHTPHPTTVGRVAGRGHRVRHSVDPDGHDFQRWRETGRRHRGGPQIHPRADAGEVRRLRGEMRGGARAAARERGGRCGRAQARARARRAREAGDSRFGAARVAVGAAAARKADERARPSLCLSLLHATIATFNQSAFRSSK